MTFSDLNLIPPILKALEKEGYEQPTPIQEQAIPIVLEGSDLLGCAQTGTGKTAAFALPIIQLLHTRKTDSPNNHRSVRCLILTPTRELAIQIGDSFKAYGKFTNTRYTVIFGGVKQGAQVEALNRGVDVMIATPGRLLDLMGQGYIKLDAVEYFVLDEADRMLDMGFIHDVKRIIQRLPKQRQSLFFSATMPDEADRLSKEILVNPKSVAVAPVSSTAETIDQWVFFVDRSNKRNLLAYVLEDERIETALIFTRTKHGANRVAKDLNAIGVKAEAIHGNKSQNARQQALTNFKSRKTKVLVATDIAARGIDVDGLSHVINYELPNIPETYVHRIGRTGRAGLTGTALSFCEAEEVPYLRDINQLIGGFIEVVEDHPWPMKEEIAAPPPPKRRPSQGSGAGRPKPARPSGGGGGNRRPSGVKR